MKNAHLRFGWLTYVKSTEKTTTSIKLRLDRFIGEVLPDPPRQAKAHLISVIGGDTQVTAVSAAVSLGDRFMVEGPGVQPIRVCLERNPQCFKGSIQLPGARNPCVTLSPCRKSLLPATYRRVQDEPCWQARKTDSSGPPSPILHGIPGIPDWADWFAGELETHRAIMPALGIGCAPVLVKGEKEQFLLAQLGRGECSDSIFRVKLGRSAGRASISQSLFLPAK